MTPEQIEMHRKRFEEIIKSFRVVKYSLDRNEHDEYRQAAVFHMWNGYLLCAENLEVELPSVLAPGGEITESDVLCRMAHNDLLFEIKFALESQGIKVKP